VELDQQRKCTSSAAPKNSRIAGVMMMMKKKKKKKKKLLTRGCQRVGLVDVGEVDLQHTTHVESSALVVVSNQGGVASRFWHLHAVVESASCGKSSEHEDDTPDVIRLRGSGADGIHCEDGRVECVSEGS